MKDNLLTFEKFSSLEDASFLIDLLKENQIGFTVEDISPDFDPTFAYNEINKGIVIKISQTQLERVHTLLEAVAQQNLPTENREHYLYSFTDSELFEVLEKPDEWSKLDFLLAQQILQQRGKEISPVTIADLKEERLNELRKPEKGKLEWIIIGWILVVNGGLLGLCMGYSYWRLKKTDSLGYRVYCYDGKTRMIGLYMFISGIMTTTFYLWLRFFYLTRYW